jgi:thioesterase domain-containing protein
VRKLQRNGPYQLCGYSFGALIAFEMAISFVEAGDRVPVLALLDSANIAYYRHMPFFDWLKFWTTRLADRGKKYAYFTAKGEFNVVYDSVSYFIRKHASLLRWRMLHQWRKDGDISNVEKAPDRLLMSKAIALSYVPRVFPGRVIVFRPMARGPEYMHNPSLGWMQVAGTGVDVHYSAGDHLSFMRQPYVGQVASALGAYLGRDYPAIDPAANSIGHS